MFRRRSAVPSRRLFRAYVARWPFVWNSYAAPLILKGEMVRKSRTAREIRLNSSGAAMKDNSQESKDNPYSPLLCIALLLTVAAATQFKIMSIWF